MAVQHKTAIESVFSNTIVSKTDFLFSLEQLELAIKEIPGYIGINDARTPLKHHFTPELYARSIEIPKDTILVTATHLTEHIAVISKGECLVSTENGTVKYTAGDVLVTKIGTKRAILVLEDLSWTTVHATDITTVEETSSLVEEDL